MADTSPSEVAARAAAGPAGPRADILNILSGTSQNVAGIIIAAAATFGTNVMVSNVLGKEAFGMVTLLTQAVFVASFATRAGMDMAVLRAVAIEVGQGRFQQIRTPVARATLIALAVSAAAAALAVAFDSAIRGLFSIEEGLGRHAVQAAALGLPFLALANVWLSATRGLKIMRYTLYIFWAGQPMTWLLLMLGGWQLSKTAWMSVLAYSASWVLASGGAWVAWRKESRGWDAAPMETGDLERLFRYAGPRAPAALFSQLLFWTDLFVLTNYAPAGEVGIYSAALRAGQILVLFLTSVSLMFSPFVADMHNRGETTRLDMLFKNLTRWSLGATMPIFLLLAVAPSEALRIFGSDFSGGQTALLILLAGQFVNVATGSVGFVLIMVGRTGWDLLVYGGSLAVNLGLAFWLAPRYGMEGAAVANAVTFALSKWARLALVKRFVAIQPYDRQYGRLIVPTAAALATMWLVHQAVPGGFLIDLLLTGGVGTAAYGVTYVTVGLTEAERRGLAALWRRLRTR